MSLTKFSLAIVLLLLSSALVGHAVDTPPVPEQHTDATISSIDVDRVRLLYDLCDRYADSLWPGFDIRKMPIAINCNDKQELLIGHPSPPAEFRPYTDDTIPGQTMLIRDGCTRYGPRSGGWSITLGGVETAYVGIVKEPLITDRWIPLLLHECFHVFQDGFRKRADSNWVELPELDADYSALLGLEGRLLYAALTDTTADMRRLASMFVAVREERRRLHSPDMAWTEGEAEFSEGTAEYVDTRLQELLVRDSTFRNELPHEDPLFQCFDSTWLQVDMARHMIQPLSGHIMTYMQAQYHQGMAECFLLDRFRPGWKSELSKPDVTQFSLLQEAMALDEAAKPALVADARAAFNFDSIATAQKQLVDEQRAKLCGVLEQPGCRYRIYHSSLPGRFKWKPRGPVEIIPSDLMESIDTRHPLPTFGMDDDLRSNRGPSLWMGGFERFEKNDLVFESQEQPVLFRLAYFEWIDPEPAADGSDCVIEGTTDDGVHYRDLKMTTDGFVLTVKQARVEHADGVVAIIPEMTEAVGIE